MRLAVMKPQFAVRLDNYFPEAGRVRLRKGSTEHATSVGSAVESLFSHQSGSVSKLYAASSGALYDVTSAGSGTSLQTGFTSNRWQTAMYDGRTFLVNGSDAPQRIEADGTLAASHGWTGIATPSNLIQVMPFAERLFFLEKDTAKVWYGPVKGIQGELSDFDFSFVHPEGGNAVAMGTISVDSGEGIDDLFALYMESGAVLLYGGTDIADADRWFRQGTYKLGRPVGSRPLVRVGSDLIAITTDGFVSLKASIREGRDDDAAISDRISYAVSEDVRDFGSNFGWQAVLHTPANWLLFNVPVGATGRQYVMNTQTLAWCRFTGWNAACWAVHGDKIYYGSGAKVLRGG